MAKFSNLQAPITDPTANQRLADTQALRARASVGAAPIQAPIAQAAAQTGAALTQATGQQALQTQQQQAGVAKAQSQQVLQQQKLADSSKVFSKEQALDESRRKLDDSLFKLNQEAADKEQQMRIDFTEGRAHTAFLQEQELMDWALTNSKNEQEFKDKIQAMEHAHSRKADLINHSYSVIMQDLSTTEYS